MFRLLVCVALFASSILIARGTEPAQSTRPITESDSVLAVYRENYQSLDGPAMIFVAWPDGRLIWSEDRLRGGAPYREGRVDPQQLTALLARFDKEGLFTNQDLNQAHFGPDSDFITVLAKSEKKQVRMQSWHELFEENDRLVADDHGLRPLEGRRRLDVLRNAARDHLFFRFVWSETRRRMADLMPSESNAIQGKGVLKAGELSWVDGPTEPKGKSEP